MAPCSGYSEQRDGRRVVLHEVDLYQRILCMAWRTPRSKPESG